MKAPEIRQSIVVRITIGMPVVFRAVVGIWEANVLTGQSKFRTSNTSNLLAPILKLTNANIVWTEMVEPITRLCIPRPRWHTFIGTFAQTRAIRLLWQFYLPYPAIHMRREVLEMRLGIHHQDLYLQGALSLRWMIWLKAWDILLASKY